MYFFMLLLQFMQALYVLIGFMEGLVADPFKHQPENWVKQLLRARGGLA
jgi:hypothetical protein